MNIPIDDQKFALAGLTFRNEGGVYRFLVPGRSDVVSANAANGTLALFPERSSAHKALLAKLESENGNN